MKNHAPTVRKQRQKQRNKPQSAAAPDSARSKHNQTLQMLHLQNTVGNRVSRKLVPVGQETLVQRQADTTPTLYFGSRQPAVSMMQHFLVSAGASIAVDGVYGPQTHRAVRAFQQAANLVVDGIVGPNTWAALQTGAVRLDTEKTPGLSAAGLSEKMAAKFAAIMLTLRPLSSGGQTMTTTHTPPWQPFPFAALTDILDFGSGLVDGNGIDDTAAPAGPDSVSGASPAGNAGSLADNASSLLQLIAGLGETDRQQLAQPLGTVTGIATQVVNEAIAGIDPGALGELDGALADFQVHAANAVPLAGGKQQGQTTIKVTKDDTYKFKCDTIACVGQELDNHSNIHGEVGHVVRLQHKKEVQFELDENTGRVVKATLDFRLERMLPEWTNVADVGQKKPCWQEEWNRFHGAISGHEAHHVALFKRFLAGLHLKCIGKTEAKAGEAVDQALDAMDKAQDAFDDATDHGKNATPSTKFNAGISC